jgi:hypothetical protein
MEGIMEGGDSNIEVAHHLSEHHRPFPDSLGHQILEMVEAIVLSIVAIATAWSGYQAALWNGHQSELYGIASKLRVQEEAASIMANQEHLYDAATVAEWLKAEAQGQTKLAELFERRVSPDFRPAFESWKKTDPINNPDAPAGPQFMTEFRSPKTEEAARLSRQASENFDQGNLARQHSDEYVRVTVTLATVLLLMAISQRFKVHVIRVGLAVVATVLLCFPIYRIFTLPRA